MFVKSVLILRVRYYTLALILLSQLKIPIGVPNLTKLLLSCLVIIRKRINPLKYITGVDQSLNTNRWQVQVLAERNVT